MKDHHNLDSQTKTANPSPLKQGLDMPTVAKGSAGTLFLLFKLNKYKKLLIVSRIWPDNSRTRMDTAGISDTLILVSPWPCTPILYFVFNRLQAIQLQMVIRKGFQPIPPNDTSSIPDCLDDLPWATSKHHKTGEHSQPALCTRAVWSWHQRQTTRSTPTIEGYFSWGGTIQ